MNVWIRPNYEIYKRFVIARFQRGVHAYFLRPGEWPEFATRALAQKDINQRLEVKE